MRPLRQRWVTWILVSILLVISTLSWIRGGVESFAGGFVRGAALMFEVLPLILSAFLVAGMIQALIPAHVVERWLGTRSGFKGILLGSLAGALVPGAPYVFYPIAAALLKSGAGLGVLIAFVCATSLWSLPRMPIEFGLMGPQVTGLRLALTSFAPPVVGMIAEALFGRRVEKLREAAP